VTYETHRAILWAVSGVLVATSVPMIVKSVRSIRTRSPYVRSWWDGGFRARSTANPLHYLRIGVASNVVVAGIVFMLLTGRWPRMEFAPRIPAGWLDVSRSAPEENLSRFKEPMRGALRKVALEARTLAVDADHGEGTGRMAYFSATVHAGRGEIDDARLAREYAEFWEAPASRKGWTLRPIHRGIVDLGGHAIGRIELETDGAEGAMHVFFYLIPGDEQYLALSCMMPSDWAARYKATCEAAAEENARGAGRRP
jgi:hypothetical protein